MSGPVVHPILDESRVQTRVRELAAQISRDYASKHLDVICTLNGAVTFTADLVRHLTIETTQHYLGFTAYDKAGDSGEVRINLDITAPLQGRHVLVVEGAVVSGRTPRYITDVLRQRRPASIAMCALILKPKLLAVELPLKYVGFELGDEMAVGYGIGHGAHRALPYIAEAAKH
jgi:hypoxanthine phosphoribosyltransferase